MTRVPKKSAKASMPPEPSFAPDPAVMFVRALRTLGAPETAASCLAVAGGDDGLVQAVKDQLAPRRLASHRHDARGGVVLSPPEARHGLVVTTGVLGSGQVGEAVDAMRVLVSRLEPGGVLAAVIDCFAAPASHVGGRDDAVLFPDLAALGYLGDEAQRRTPLGPAAWLNLIAGSGLEIVQVAGYGDEPPTPETLEEHAARLAPFEPRELATGRLLVVARAPGGGQ